MDGDVLPTSRTKVIVAMGHGRHEEAGRTAAFASR